MKKLWLKETVLQWYIDGLLIQVETQVSLLPIHIHLNPHLLSEETNAPAVCLLLLHYFTYLPSYLVLLYVFTDQILHTAAASENSAKVLMTHSLSILLPGCSWRGRPGCIHHYYPTTCHWNRHYSVLSKCSLSQEKCNEIL